MLEQNAKMRRKPETIGGETKMVHSKKHKAAECNAAHAIPLTDAQKAAFRKFNNASLVRHGLAPKGVA
jgi:hypothetical protein